MNIIQLKGIRSTNLYAREHLWELNPPVAIFSSYQTGGMGTKGRVFHSPPGGLYMTYVDGIESPFISMLVPLGITEALDRLGVKTRIQWPNDIYLDGKKLGGVLIEKVEGLYLIGVGINCNTALADFPLELRGMVTTLKEAMGKEYDIIQLGVGIIENILYFVEHPEYIHSLYSERMYGVGMVFDVEVGGGVLRGVVKGVNKEGHLLLKTTNGTIAIPSGTLRKVGL